MQGTADIFWSREPITGPKGTKEKPAIIPSFNDHRVVGLEIEQVRGVPLFRLRVRLRMRALHQLLHAFLRQNHRRAALTTRPSLRAGRHLVQAGGGAAALRRGAVLQVRAPVPHMLPMSTPRLAWPPTVKLSGAATHAVNLPLAGCSEWRVASTSFTPYCRGRAAAFACGGRLVHGGDGTGEGAAPSRPAEMCREGVLRDKTPP